MRYTVPFISAWLVAAAFDVSISSQASNPTLPGTEACAALATATFNGLATLSTTYESASTTQPAHCVVRGSAAPRTGADGKPYETRFELRLPTAWSGRFLYQGGGGNDGVVAPAVGRNMGSFPETGLQRGFAVVTTDAGHQGPTPEFGVARSITTACDAPDGATDGMVLRPEACRFDPKRLQCAAAKDAGCLTGAQVAALERTFAGPRDSSGRALYVGQAWDPGIAAPGWRQWKLGSSQTGSPNAANTTLMSGALAYEFFTPPDPATDTSSLRVSFLPSLHWLWKPGGCRELRLRRQVMPFRLGRRRESFTARRLGAS